MKIALLVCISSAVLFAAENPNVKTFDTLTVGTNTYKEVTLTKRDAANATLKHSTGLRAVRILELSPDAQGDWADAALAHIPEAKSEPARGGETNSIPVSVLLRSQSEALAKEVDALLALREKHVAVITQQARAGQPFVPIPKNATIKSLDAQIEAKRKLNAATKAKLMQIELSQGNIGLDERERSKSGYNRK